MKILPFLFLSIFISSSGEGQNSTDEQKVKKVIIAFQDDFNDGSFKNAGSYTTKDWEHLNPLGGITKGRDEVLKEVRAVHQAFLKGVTMTIESMAIRFITHDVSIVDVIHKVTDFQTPDGVRHENEKHLKTYIVVKKNGKWLLTHDQNTMVASKAAQ